MNFDWRPCWFTLDPKSLVITSHFNEEIDELDDAVFQNEYVEDDFNKMPTSQQLAKMSSRSPEPLKATCHGAPATGISSAPMDWPMSLSPSCEAGRPVGEA